MSENKELVHLLFEKVFNARNLDALPQILADDFVGGRGEKGWMEYATTIANLHHGFPDVHLEIEDLVAEDDRVVARFRMRGTHTGKFAGHEPSGRTIDTTSIAIYRFNRGKIDRIWLQSDRLGLLEQIGALPQRRSSAA